MGWIWASPSPPKPSTPAQDKPAPASASSTQSVAPNEPVDPEIEKFLSLFAADVGAGPEKDPAQTSSSSTIPSAAQSSNTSPGGSSSWFALKSSNRTAAEEPNAPRRDALSESLLPTDMSCRQAFDLAWGCNSLGGQWNAVYRHGEMRSCSDHWDDFWFCMRTKGYTGEMKAAAVRQHYRNKEHKKYYAPGRPSSEDIWEAREQRLPAGSAFSEGIDVAHDVSDDEWRQQESERRRKIREGLGFTTAPST